jgi:hypothetical protein
MPIPKGYIYQRTFFVRVGVRRVLAATLSPTSGIVGIRRPKTNNNIAET